MPAKFLEALGKRIEPGLHQVEGTFRFQACSDDVCEMPQTIRFQLALTIEAGIPAAPKKGLKRGSSCTPAFPDGGRLKNPDDIFSHPARPDPSSPNRPNRKSRKTLAAHDRPGLALEQSVPSR